MTATHFTLLLGVGLGAALIIVLAWLDENIHDSRVARADAAYRRRVRRLYRLPLPADRTVRRG